MRKDSWRSRVSPSAISRGPDPKRFDGRVYTSLPFVEDERGLVPPRETRRASHLYLVPSAGGEPKQLTSGDLSQRAPDWSPDGRAIVFVQDSTDTSEVRNQVRPQLYVLSVADGAVRRLATPYVENVAPAWSPVGTSIASICSKGRGEENDLSWMRATGAWRSAGRASPRAGWWCRPRGARPRARAPIAASLSPTARRRAAAGPARQTRWGCGAWGPSPGGGLRCANRKAQGVMRRQQF